MRSGFAERVLCAAALMLIAAAVAVSSVEQWFTDNRAVISLPVQTEIADNSQARAAVNINTAALDELISLKGIGEKKAQAIIDYRRENGEFGQIEDIMLVKGIGEKIFENIKDSITV